jgi:hypothetical protein
MNDVEILCYILFLDQYGIFLRLCDRWYAYLYGGQMELWSIQERF